MQAFDLRINIMLLTPFLGFKLLFHFLFLHTLKLSYIKLFLIHGMGLDLSSLLSFSHTVLSLPGTHIFHCRGNYIETLTPNVMVFGDGVLGR